MICDFCLGPDVRWEYPAVAIVDAEHPVFDALAGDGFAVCDACHRMLVLGDDVGLARRMVLVQPVHVPPGSVVDGGVVVYGPPLEQLAKAERAVRRFRWAQSGPPSPTMP